MKELHWLANDKPSEIQGFEKLSIFDYWTLLDKKILIAKQSQPRRK